jgi:hypothetical protein
MEAYDNQEVTIHPRPAISDDFTDHKPDLLLIDPPGLRTKSKKQYPDLAELLCFFDKVSNTILWFSITAQGKGSPARETGPSEKAKCECLTDSLLLLFVGQTVFVRADAVSHTVCRVRLHMLCNLP